MIPDALIFSDAGGIDTIYYVRTDNAKELERLMEYLRTLPSDAPVPVDKVIPVRFDMQAMWDINGFRFPVNLMVSAYPAPDWEKCTVRDFIDFYYDAIHFPMDAHKEAYWKEWKMCDIASSPDDIEWSKYVDGMLQQAEYGEDEPNWKAEVHNCLVLLSTETEFSMDVGAFLLEAIEKKYPKAYKELMQYLRDNYPDTYREYEPYLKSNPLDNTSSKHAKKQKAGGRNKRR